MKKRNGTGTKGSFASGFCAACHTVADMKSLLKTELRKAVINKYFIISLTAGVLFVLISLHFALTTYAGFEEAIQWYAKTGDVKYRVVETHSLYNLWIGGEFNSMGYALFFMLFPVLCMLPYGWSFFEDRKTGYDRVIIHRSGRKNYFLAKLIATFTSGGLVVLIPLALSLLLTALFIPAVKPNVVYDLYFQFQHGNFLSEIVYQHPLIVALIYLLIDFVFGGLFACLSITASFFLKSSTAVLVVPYIVTLCFDSAQMFLAYMSTVSISPIKILHYTPVVGDIKAFVLFGWMGIFFLATIPFVLYRGCRHEIY